MTKTETPRRNWGLNLIALWLLFNGVPGLLAQLLRLLGVEAYEVTTIDAGYDAMDWGVVVMDVLVANPVYILGGILLWRRHPWGTILSVAGLLLLTYLIGMFAVAFTDLDYWDNVPVEDVVLIVVTIPVNVLALAYLVRDSWGSQRAAPTS
jgi:hypothetical protein